MTTVVSPSSSDSGTGVSLMMGILLLAVVFLLLYFGIPAMRGAGGGTNINVPDKMDVNVNPPQQ